ncbi:THUMP domain-containing class I SAM-dependent RNA methyltransferase [Thermovibrio ammonificans]
MKLFAVSQPGIEQVTADELQTLGLNSTTLPGGVEFEGGLRELYRANLWLRSASRVLVRLCTFRAKHFAELVRKASKCPWSHYITPELPIKVRATSRRSKLYHTKAIEERVLRAIKEAVGFEPKTTDYEDEGTSVIVRFENDICTISVNSSGALLHKRGYRVAETEAPLRENLAAAMVLLSGWRGEVPLVDPFCGSGTIPIEAALIAANIPPGFKREFAFMKWPNFDSSLWEEVKSEALSGVRPVNVPVLGFDIDPDAVSAAEKNARAAGVERFVTFKNFSFPELKFSEAFIVTNPPYGVRLTFVRASQVYRRLGEWVETNFKRYKLLFLAPGRRLARETGLPVEQVTHFSNGGITVGLWVAEKG